MSPSVAVHVMEHAPLEQPPEAASGDATVTLDTPVPVGIAHEPSPRKNVVVEHVPDQSAVISDEAAAVLNGVEPLFFWIPAAGPKMVKYVWLQPGTANRDNTKPISNFFILGTIARELNYTE